MKIPKHFNLVSVIFFHIPTGELGAFSEVVQSYFSLENARVLFISDQPNRFIHCLHPFRFLGLFLVPFDGISISPDPPVVKWFFQKSFFKKGVDRIGRLCYNTSTVEDTPERGERPDRLTRSLGPS